MSIELYDLARNCFLGGLHSHKHHLQKAVAHIEAGSIDPAALLHARLYPDMFDLTRQTQALTDSARRAMDRLAGDKPSSVADDETSFAELIARVDSTIAHVAGFDRARFEGAEDREIVLEFEQPLKFSGRSYLLGFTLPNFLFHVTTAYGILRHSGVELGKRDFLTAFVGAQA